MYNYHADTVLVVDIALFGIVIITVLVIFACVILKNHLYELRRRSLLDIKKNVYEMVLAHKGDSSAVYQPFVSSITPQQLVDIATNRRLDIVFFNDSEREFFKSCFVKPDGISDLERIVKSAKSKWQKIEAILALGYTQTDAAVNVIKETLSSKDKDTSYFSIISLGQIKSVESARALLNFMKKDPSSSYKIISILEGFPKDIAEDVFKLTDYHDPMVRYRALMLLSKFPSRDYLTKLQKFTEDMTPEVRAAACDCIGNISGAGTKPTLLKCLKDDNWLVRSHAIIALEKTMKEAAVPEIASLINDASWFVVEAVKVVMTSHIEVSLPFIEQFLEGGYEIAKKYSIYALQDAGYMPKLLNDAASGNERAIRLLKNVVRSRVHTGLDTVIGSLDSSTRMKVLEIMADTKET